MWLSLHKRFPPHKVRKPTYIFFITTKTVPEQAFGSFTAGAVVEFVAKAGPRFDAFMMPYKITDDSGFLAVIDPDAYQGFVHAEWTWEIIQKHFIREMRARRLLIWNTGMENFWKVDVSLAKVRTPGFRDIVGSIRASKGRLLLTNYDSLTMAAGYSDVRLPQAEEQEQVLTVSAGLYDCRIIQLSDPDSDAPFEEPVNFIYEFTKASEPRKVWSHIPWGAA